MSRFLIIILTNLTLIQQPISGARINEADSLKVIELNEQGYELGNTDLDSALVILSKAYSLSEKLNSDYLKAISAYNKGCTLGYKGKLDSATQYVLSALDYFETTQDTDKMFGAYRKISQFYQQVNQFDETWAYIQKVKAIAEASGDEKQIGTYLNDFGSFYINKGWTIDDSLVVFFQKAEKYILEAIPHFKNAGYERGVALCYGNLANIATDLGDTKKAISYGIKGLSFFEKLDLDIYSVISYNQLSKAYTKIEKFDSGIYYAKKSLALAEQLDSDIDRRNANAWLAHGYEGLGDYKRALSHHREYHKYHFTIVNDENNHAISELDKKYQTEKKIAENDLLKKDNLIKSTTINTQQSFIIAAVVIILALVAVAFFIYRAYNIRKQLISKIQLQKNEIESDKQTIELQNAKLEELDKAKSRFFANISHDLRSPLTMLLGNIESVIEDKDSYLTHKSETNLSSSLKNGEKIIQLSDEINDLSMLEDGKINLELQPVKVIPYLQLLIEMFRSATDQKQVDLTFEYNVVDDCTLNIDANQFEKIIYNLLSNAIKFTEPNDSISISVIKHENDSVKIEIKDTGSGIPEKSLPFIFDRYYQSVENKYNPKEGLGIGLSLVRELVNLHDGKISVESEVGVGSTFAMVFAKSVTDATETPLVPQVSDYTKNKALLDKSLMGEIQRNSPIGQVSFDNKEKSDHLILIVEDHPEIKDYVNGIISSKHPTILASNGKEALEVMANKSISLVVTDLMMPWMDGFELISAMKEDTDLQKIPVLVLSARTGEADKHTILSQGINNFLSKPFDKNELLMRIDNLLNQKENWSSNTVISTLNNLKPKNEIEKGILKKLETYIISRVSDSSLSVTDLGMEMAASERQIYRLLKNTANITPLELIKEVRYQYAHQLFTEQKVNNYSEAAKAIGMKNASHFKEEYLRRYENSLIK